MDVARELVERESLRSRQVKRLTAWFPMKTQTLLFVIVLSAVLAAEEIPSRSALSVRGLNEALIGVAKVSPRPLRW